MAIPTVYAGVQFRSRLEARWAAFFDLLKWPWDYEPIDLDGYIPDFLIRAREPFLVEVKGRAEDVASARAKIERSGWRADALIVTDAWGPAETGCLEGLVIGSLGEFNRNVDEDPTEIFWSWDAGLLMRHDSECYHCGGARPSGVFAAPPKATGGYGLCHATNDYSDRLGSACWKRHILEPDDPEAIRLWREAGNRVQWRSPRTPAPAAELPPGIFRRADGVVMVNTDPEFAAQRAEWFKTRGGVR